MAAEVFSGKPATNFGEDEAGLPLHDWDRKQSSPEQNPELKHPRLHEDGLALAKAALTSDWGPGRSRAARNFLEESAMARHAENLRRHAVGEAPLPELTYDSQGDAS